MKRPNFFVIGAPKCGTTSMAKWLSQHPQIFMSAVKEPHYFDRDGPRLFNDRREYEKLFSRASEDHLAVGEASTGYLHSRTAVPQILDYEPNAKFIVMLRNPVEMAPALHRQMLFELFEDTEDFREAWGLQAQRATGQRIPSFCPRPSELAYGERCNIGEQVSRLLQQVPGDRCHFIFMQDLKSDAREVYRDTLQFLEVADDGRIQFPVENASKTTRGKLSTFVIKNLLRIRRHTPFTRTLRTGIGAMLKNWNVKSKPGITLDDDMRAELLDYFRDTINLLESQTGRDLSGWREENEDRTGGN